MPGTRRNIRTACLSLRRGLLPLRVGGGTARLVLLGAVSLTPAFGQVLDEPGRLTTLGSSPAPVLTVSKSAAASVVSGQNFPYTLTYGNTGSGAPRAS
jgi:hypothetical protein